MQLIIVLLFSFLGLFQCISILTQNIDIGRTGWNSKETVLTAQNVPTLKLLHSIKTSSPCTTQVLYYEAFNLGTHKNVLFCWTNADTDNTNTTVYAFDADTYDTIWAHYIGQGAIWATHAPVIDPSANNMYFVYKNDNDDGYNYLIGIDLKTGAHLQGSPLLINASVPGTGAASKNGVVVFQNTDAGNGVRLHNNVRTSLLFVNGIIIFGTAHNSDSPPYHGWVFSYKYDTTAKQFVRLNYFCTTPNDSEGGVWQSGHGIASDGTSFYFTTGNGNFNPRDGSYGMSVIKMTIADFQVQDYFTPANWKSFSGADLDVGGCGPTLIPNTNYIFVGVTKYGSVHLIDKTNMGKFVANQDSCRQTIHLTNIRPGGNPVVWNNNSTSIKIYTWAPGGPLYQFNFDTNTQMIATPPISWSGNTGGGGLQISSNGQSNPILWAFGLGQMYAFDLTKDITAGPIFTSRQTGPSSWGWPTVSNGKVFLPGYDSNLRVYGLGT